MSHTGDGADRRSNDKGKKRDRDSVAEEKYEKTLKVCVTHVSVQK